MGVDLSTRGKFLGMFERGSQRKLIMGINPNPYF
jgi:hypothetical protein